MLYVLRTHIPLSWFISAILLTLNATEDHLEFCHNELFTAECSSNEVIVMILAQYGRMAIGRCVKKDYGYIGCNTNVIDIAHAYCSGRRMCEIQVPNAILDSLEQPCPEDFKSYFRAAYRCQRVISIHQEQCRSNPVEITVPVGLIPSVLSQETTCGTYKAPWLLKAQRGQRIRITLLDYSVVSLESSVLSPSGEQCVAYASIREKGIRTPFTLCGGRETERHVYRSQSNVVEIIMQGAQKKYPRYFIMQFQFHGCEDLSPPAHGWARRSGNTTEFGCDQSELSWKLSCQNGVWVGELRNCTAGITAEQWKGISLPLSLAIGVVVLIALCIAACILFSGIVYLQRRRRHRDNQQVTDPLPAHGQIIAKEDNYRKAFYEGFPPKPEDPRLPRALGPNGENAYASITDNNHTPGCDEFLPAARNIPFSHYETNWTKPLPQLGTTPSRKCSGTVHVVPDHNGEPREYFVLDQKATQFT